MVRPLLRLALLALALLALPALARGASDPVLEAARRTAEAKSVTFQLSLTTTAAGRRSTLTGSGAQRGTSVRLSLRASGAGGPLRIDAVLVQEGARLVMYLRSPVFAAQLPPGKSWLRVDLSAQAAGVGIDVSALFGASHALAPLEKGLVSSARLGRELVAGKPATRYRVVVDVRRAARALPAYGRQVAALERATGVRLGRVSYLVWIGGDGRIRRLRYATPGPGGARTEQTLTFLAYDVAVRIAAPPRAQVFTP